MYIYTLSQVVSQHGTIVAAIQAPQKVCIAILTDIVYNAGDRWVLERSG